MDKSKVVVKRLSTQILNVARQQTWAPNHMLTVISSPKSGEGSHPDLPGGPGNPSRPGSPGGPLSPWGPSSPENPGNPLRPLIPKQPKEITTRIRATLWVPTSAIAEAKS